MVPLTLTGEDGRGPTLKTMANRIIGAIPYSLGLRLKNPSEKDSEKEIVAFRQERETIDLALLAKHIKEHGSSFSKGTIYGVLQDAVECIVECLQGGYGVLLNGLGKFGVTLKCSGADMDEEFSAANITGVKVTFNPDGEMIHQLNTNTEFEYVGSRAAQMQAKKEEKARVAAGETTQDITPSGSGGSGGSGSGDAGDVTP